MNDNSSISSLSDSSCNSKTTERGIIIPAAYMFRVPKSAIRDKLKEAFDKPDFLYHIGKVDVLQYAEEMWEDTALKKTPDVYYLKEGEKTKALKDDIDGEIDFINFTFGGNELHVSIFNHDGKPDKHGDSIIFWAFGFKILREAEKNTFRFDKFFTGSKMDIESAIWSLQLLDICGEPLLYAMYDIHNAHKGEEYEWLEVGQKIDERLINDEYYDTLGGPYFLHYDDAEQTAREHGWAVAKIKYPKYTKRYSKTTIEDIIQPEGYGMEVREKDILSNPDKPPIRGILECTSYNCSVKKADIRDKIKEIFEKPDFLAEVEKLDIISCADVICEQPGQETPDVYYLEGGQEKPEGLLNDIEGDAAYFNYSHRIKIPESHITIFGKPEKKCDSITYLAFAEKVLTEREPGTFKFDRFIHSKKMDYISFIWTLQLLDICEEPVVYAMYDIKRAYDGEKFEWLEAGQKICELGVENDYSTLTGPYCSHYEDAEKIALEKGCAIAKIRHRKYTRRCWNNAIIEKILLPFENHLIGRQ